jgi:hypothetical protein
MRSPYLRNGTVYIRATLTNPEYGFKDFYDTLYMSKAPKIIFTHDSSICRGDSIRVTYKVENVNKINYIQYGFNKVKYPNTNQEYLILPPSDSTVKISVFLVDTLGCNAHTLTNIRTFDYPKLSIAPFSNVCQDHPLITVSENAPILTKSTFIMWSNDGYIVQTDSNLYGISPKNIPNSKFKSGIYNVKMYASLLDSNGCKTTESADFDVFQKPYFTIKSASLCQNTFKYALSPLIIPMGDTKMDRLKGYWTIDSVPNGIDTTFILWRNKNFVEFQMGQKSETKYQGDFYFHYFVKDTFTSCVFDTFNRITVINEPSLSFVNNYTYCYNSQSIDLVNFTKVNNEPPTSGKFKFKKLNGSDMHADLYAANITDFSKVPKNLPPGYWEVEYSGPNYGCPDTATFNFRVLLRPVSRFSMNNQEVLNIHAAQIEAINNAYIVDNSDISILWNAGTGKSTDTSTSWHFKFNYPKTVKDYWISLAVKSNITGCSDTSKQKVMVTDYAKNNQEFENNSITITSNGEILTSNSNLRILKIAIYDLNGKQIDVRKSVANGLYLFNIQYEYQGQLRSFNRKSVIQQ